MPIHMHRTAAARRHSGAGGFQGQFPGDPGDGNYYVAWADGPGGGSPARGSITYGQSVSQNKLAVYHNYSVASNGRLDTDELDEAISADLIPSQSFKLASSGGGSTGPLEILAGTHNAVIDGDAAACIARAPHPIWLCYFHEPGGDFTDDTQRANYRAAFRYIVGRYRAAGVTNVMWTQIQEAPFDFRPSPFTGGTLGGARTNSDATALWYKFHPDWKGTHSGGGGTTLTSADWYTGADQVCDIFGLDIYTPLVGGTSFQPYDRIWRDVNYRLDLDSFPLENYAGVGIFEMGWSDISDPDPDWVAYAAATLVEQATYNIKVFTYWNNNNDTPPRYDMAEAGNASDVDGDKFDGWQDIVDGAVTIPAPPPPEGPPTVTDTAEVTNWHSSTTPRDTSTTLDWNAGDLIVVVGVVGDESATLAVPTATGLTFTQAAFTNNASGNFCDTWVWTATAANNGSSLINIVRSAGTSVFGIGAIAFGSHGGLGNIATNTSTAQTVSLARSGNQSAVVFGGADWSGSQAVATFTPSGSSVVESSGDAGGTIGAHMARWPDQGSAGTTSYGLSSTSTGSFAKIAVEILAA